MSTITAGNGIDVDQLEGTIEAAKEVRDYLANPVPVETTLEVL